MRKIPLERVREYVSFDPAGVRKEVPHLQNAVFVMCGGGFLGDFAATQPADFYIDSRCGRLPYGRRAIMQAVEILATIAVELELDPHNMPSRPSYHNLGTF